MQTLGLSVARLGIPPGTDVAQALALVRANVPTANAQPNALYTLTAMPCDNAGCYGWTLVAWTGMDTSCRPRLPHVGMIDTAVDADHPAFKDQDLQVRSFRSTGRASPTEHGTAVASLIVGETDSGYPGMLPGAAFHVADVFHVGDDGNLQASVVDVVRGLDWLAQAGTAVINASIAGADHPLLQQAVRRLTARGIVVVAAAGNAGPAADPVYPAGYPEAISVTAVDRHRRPYAMANRGDYISFASPGVEVWAAAPGGEGTYHTGTSFAAAFATAIVAEVVERYAVTDKEDILEFLRPHAEDLGPEGRDPVFGYGLMRAPDLCTG